VSQNNLNREHAYLRAVFNELTRLGYWKKENPLSKLRQFKIEERELTFLTSHQINNLIAALRDSRNLHALLITKICVATGARWGAPLARLNSPTFGQVKFPQAGQRRL